MIRCFSLVLVIAAVMGTTTGARAGQVQPPQPPACSWCPGPPPPPVLVPTVAPVEVVPVEVISVNLSPTHVLRGHSTSLHVSATTGDQVSATLLYRGAKPMVYKLQVGSSGTLEKVWKIPRGVNLGKAQLKVTVADPNDPYSTTITFDVVK